MAGRGRDESLADLLGGRRGAVDASVPPVVFAAGYLVARDRLWVAVAAALVAGVVVAGFRVWRGRRPRAVVLGLLGTAVAAVVVLRTGRAEDFFLVQLAANAASALVFLASVAVRWPLLGVMLGLALGQKARWRRDPALLRGYDRGSLVWAAQYALRVLVFLPLWLAGHVVALAVARVALTWPLVVATLAVSWWVLRRSLPAGHPGVRHPRTAQVSPAPA